MSDLLQIVKGLSAQPKCVLVLGARTEAMLNWLFSLTVTQVVFVEPEKALYEKASVLHSAKGKPDNVTIIHGAPVIESEQKTTAFFASSVLGFSSVLPPNVIKSIRPALEFTEQQVPVIALKPLLKQFEISEGRPCLLISQLNGAEQQCLNTQILSAFTHVVIQSSLKPIFGENKPVEKLKKELTEWGRDHLELAESMPPFSNFVATKKVHAEQALNYFSQRQQHREIKIELEKKLSTSQSDAQKVSEELQQAKEQLKAAQQQSEEKQKQLGDELLQAKEQLKAAQQQSEEKQKQLGEELQQAKEQLQTAKQQVEEKDKQQSKLTQQFAQLENEKEQQRESLTAQVEKASELENRHVKAVEITSKLNLKLQSDLDDLRLRFAEKVKVEKELNELISELYVKLRQAANFYYQLEEKHPELTDFTDE